jgi:LysM repeat protein
VVQPGDTLWRLAGRVAPDRDPLAEIDELRRLNHLDGPVLRPGQVLRTR